MARPAHRHHRAADGDHRSRRLLHPDEHGFAADVARGHSPQEVSELAAARIQRRWLGRLIVITAPLTEIIDHAGYFIQMSMASLPMWLEGILHKKYPNWRQLEYNDDGSAGSSSSPRR